MALATGTRSVLGPLTTTFRRLSSCTHLYGEEAYLTSGTAASQAQHCATVSGWGNVGNGVNASWTGVSTLDDVECWPPATVTSPTQATSLDGRGFYSPGLVCPDGYTTACMEAMSDDGSQSTITQGTSFAFQFKPVAGETAVGCCPR